MRFLVQGRVFHRLGMFQAASKKVRIGDELTRVNELYGYWIGDYVCCST